MRGILSLVLASTVLLTNHGYSHAEKPAYGHYGSGHSIGPGGGNGSYGSGSVGPGGDHGSYPGPYTVGPGGGNGNYPGKYTAGPGGNGGYYGDGWRVRPGGNRGHYNDWNKVIVGPGGDGASYGCSGISIPQGSKRIVYDEPCGYGYRDDVGPAFALGLVTGAIVGGYQASRQQPQVRDCTWSYHEDVVTTLDGTTATYRGNFCFVGKSAVMWVNPQGEPESIVRISGR